MGTEDHQSIYFQKCFAKQSPGAPESAKTWGWPASYLSIICFLYYCLFLTIFAISNWISVLFSYIAFQLCSCAMFSYDLHVTKWSIVSDFNSQTTHKLSKFFMSFIILDNFIFPCINFEYYSNIIIFMFSPNMHIFVTLISSILQTHVVYSCVHEVIHLLWFVTTSADPQGIVLHS